MGLCRVFVYGTLMTGMINFSIVKPFVISVIPGKLCGKVYDLSYGFPGAILEGEDQYVVGELIELREIETAMKLLDQLEDYYGPNSPHNMYERSIANIVTLSGEIFDAYVYMWAKPEQLNEIGTLIDHGSWRVYVSEKNNMRKMALKGCFLSEESKGSATSSRQ